MHQDQVVVLDLLEWREQDLISTSQSKLAEIFPDGDPEQMKILNQVMLVGDSAQTLRTIADAIPNGAFDLPSNSAREYVLGAINFLEIQAIKQLHSKFEETK